MKRHRIVKKVFEDGRVVYQVQRFIDETNIDRFSTNDETGWTNIPSAVREKLEDIKWDLNYYRDREDPSFVIIPLDDEPI